jgi:phage baseplate assembly protein W
MTIKKYTDLSLDFKPHPLSGDVTPKVNIDAIKQSMRIIISLDTFDIPFNPGAKSSLKRFLFEDLNVVTKSGLVKRLEWLIKTYEKRVILHDIKIIPFRSDDGFDITITYKIKALNVDDAFNYSFQRIR